MIHDLFQSDAHTQTKHALHFPTFRVALSLHSCHFYPHSHGRRGVFRGEFHPRHLGVPHHAARCKDLGRWSHGKKRVGSLDWKLPEVENTATFLLITHRFIFWLVCTVHSSLRCLLRVELGLNCTSANRVHWQCRNLQAIHVTSCNIPYKIS